LEKYLQDGLLTEAMLRDAELAKGVRLGIAGREVSVSILRQLRALLHSGGARSVDLCERCGAEIHTGLGLREICDGCYLERRREQHRAVVARSRQRRQQRALATNGQKVTISERCSHCGGPMAKERFGKKAILFCKKRCELSGVTIVPA